MVNYFVKDGVILRVSKERMRPRGERSEIITAPFYRFPKVEIDGEEVSIIEDTVEKDAYQAKVDAHQTLKNQMKNVNTAIDNLSNLAELKVFLKKLVRVINREINNEE
jgi:hypothetical protein